MTNHSHNVTKAEIIWGLKIASCDMSYKSCGIIASSDDIFLLYLKTEIPIFFQLSYIFFIKSFSTACTCLNKTVQYIVVRDSSAV